MYEVKLSNSIYQKNNTIKSIILIIIIDLISIIVGINFYSVPIINKSQILFFAFILSLQLIITVYFIEKTTSMNNLAFIFGNLFFFFLTVVRALYVLFDYQSAQSSYTLRLFIGRLTSDQMIKIYATVFFQYSLFLSFSAIGYLSTLIGRSVNRKPMFLGIARYPSRYSLISLFLIFSAINIIRAYRLHIPIIYSSAPSSAIESFVYTLVTFLLILSFKRSRTMMVTIAGLYCFTYLKRERIFPILLFFYLLIRLNIRKKKIFDIFMICLITLILVFAGVLKNLALYGIEAVFNAFDKNLVSLIMNEFSSGDVLPLMISYYDKFPILSISRTIINFPKWFLPRFIFPNKPFSSTLTITSSLFPAFGADIPYGIIGGTFVYFGYELSVFVFLFFGCVIGYIDYYITKIQKFSTDVRIYYISLGILITATVDIFRVGSEKSFFSLLLRLLLVWTITLFRPEKNNIKRSV